MLHFGDSRFSLKVVGYTALVPSPPINRSNGKFHGTDYLEGFRKRGIARAGTIVEVEDFPEARKPACQLTVNFPRKRIATFSFEVLMRGFYLPSGEVVWSYPEPKVPNRAKRG